MTVEKEKKVWYRRLATRIWYFFNSIKLTLFTLLTLALVSIIGTVVEQNKPFRDYVSAYGEKWAEIIMRAGFNDMYHTVWFSALLLLLVLNILICTMERFPPKWKVLFANKPNFNPGFIDKLEARRTLRLDADSDAAKGRVVKALKKKRFKFKEEAAGSGHSYYAWKGLIGRFGPELTHISLFVILAGAVLGSFYGYKDFKVVTVGNEFSVKEADYKLRLDKFWIDYYDTGQIRQYNSILTVSEGGKDIFTKQIWVNEPLLYKGIRFYQSSWGNSWNKIKAAEIGYKYEGSEEPDIRVRLLWNQKKAIPGTEYSVKLIGFTADFAFDERTKTVFSKSINPDNPAIHVELYKGDKKVSTPWLFMNYPALFSSIPDSKDSLVFSTYRGVLFSGISVNKDPGTNVVWVGASIMGIGFLFSFFVFHKRLYIHVRDDEGGTEVLLGGLINKNKMALDKDLDSFVQEIKGEKIKK